MRNGDDPSFDDVDNPGDWNDFIFRPVYNKKGVGANAAYEYTGQELPTGAVPVKPYANGKRILENFWEFHYNGWMSLIMDSVESSRQYATVTNIFPSERKSTLDYDPKQ